MTSGYDIDSYNPTEGHSAWIDYALQNNPNIIIFIAIQHLIFQMEILMVHDQIGIRSHQTMVSILFKNFMITTLMKWSIVK